MCKALLVLTIVSSCALKNLVAQAPANGASKPFYEVSAEGGLVAGPFGNNLQLRLVNGVAYKTWFGGLGFGTDQYYHRTVPLFFELRRQIKKPGKGLYLYALAGTNFVSRVKSNLVFEQTEYVPGGYFDAGPGYKFHLSGKLFLRVECGYGIKAYRETLSLNDNNPPEPGTVTRNHYTLHDLSMRVGLGF